MAITAVTREYSPGSCRNSKNPMRHSPRREMKHKSPTLGAEEFRVPNQSLWSLNVPDGTQECWGPRPMSQDEKNTDVTSGMQIARCTPNQIEMKPISALLAP